MKLKRIVVQVPKDTPYRWKNSQEDWVPDMDFPKWITVDTCGPVIRKVL